MNKDDFEIGKGFACGGKKWLCTDIGTRTIIAIDVSANDESWFSGPPYAVCEHVFDEEDICACTI